MKKMLFSLLFFLSFGICINAQEINFNDVATSGKGSYNKVSFTSYISKDGAVYKIGDTLKIGVPSSNKTFAFITEGDGLLIPITQLTAVASGSNSEIMKIWLVGTKRAGYFVSFKTKGSTGVPGFNYTIQVENAIAAGELKSFGKTSDEALTELKKAKDKLDLDLITPAKYDSIKADLVKYIK